MKLRDHFDRLFVISLPCKEDRRKRLEANLVETGMAGPGEITWVNAISGDYCPPPLWFEAGGGAWGCLRSHLRIMEDAMMSDLRSYCVLEDDAFFDGRACGLLDDFMSKVPGDWGQAYLGGQHRMDPEVVRDREGVLACRGVIRTHAFAVHRRAYNKVYQYLNHAPDYMARGPLHVDQHFCQAHERRLWETYAPAWWIAGQEEGMSNISSNYNRRIWWHPKLHLESLPVVYLDAGPAYGIDPELDRHVHFGDTRKNHCGGNLSVNRCAGSAGQLTEWLAKIGSEALDRGLLPGICHPAITIEDVRNCWSGEVVQREKTNIAQLAALAFGCQEPGIAAEEVCQRRVAV